MAEVDRRIADLQVTRHTLQTAVRAGCDDLISCAGEPRCPLPFTEVGRSEADPS
jgi:hypothetical protein